MEYCINVSFNENGKNYFFSTTDPSIKVGSKVVATTVAGTELGNVTTNPIPIEDVKSPFTIIPIVRVATKEDIRQHAKNIEDAKKARLVFERLAKQEKLEMDLTDASYTLDKTKIMFTYIASERIDFRNLLKLLASELHTRIELKQVNARERAQIIGGIGVCGLPLCCTTFLKDFESISLSKAKNQMLAINIPKLSGQCGKLMCCLNFEDQAYTDAKKYFPQINSTVKYQNKIYKVTSYNIISKIIRLECQDGVEFITLQDFKKLK